MEDAAFPQTILLMDVLGQIRCLPSSFSDDTAFTKIASIETI